MTRPELIANAPDFANTTNEAAIAWVNTPSSSCTKNLVKIPLRMLSQRLADDLVLFEKFEAAKLALNTKALALDSLLNSEIADDIATDAWEAFVTSFGAALDADEKKYLIDVKIVEISPEEYEGLTGTRKQWIAACVEARGV